MFRKFTLITLVAGLFVFHVTLAQAQVFSQPTCAPTCCHQTICQPAFHCQSFQFASPSGPACCPQFACCPTPVWQQPALAFRCAPAPPHVVQCAPVAPVIVWAHPCPPISPQIYTGVMIPGPYEECIEWCDNNYADPSEILACYNYCAERYPQPNQ